jgi:hypothetical protein
VSHEQQQGHCCCYCCYCHHHHHHHHHAPRTTFPPITHSIVTSHRLTLRRHAPNCHSLRM